MDRRNFLAFLPALSAIPFIGKDIIQNESGIHILKPTPIIEPGLSNGFDFSKVEIRLYQEGQHIANAYLTSMDVQNYPIEISGRDHNGAKQTVIGNQEITFTGVVNGAMVFDRDKSKKKI